MRRKTAPKDSVHPEVSRAAASEVGLIARTEESAQSAMGEYVLDNRSHRTPQGSGVRGRRARLSFRPKACKAPHPLQPIVRPCGCAGAKRPQLSQARSSGEFSLASLTHSQNAFTPMR
jgi:hypothetical protein